MTNREQVIEYIYLLREEMGLSDWAFSVKEDAELDSHAQVSIPYAQRAAVIHITPEFYSNEPQMQKMILVHEMVHCHIDQMHTPVRKLEEILGSVTHESFFSAYHYNYERTVDDIAVAWAMRLPNPKEDEEA